MCKTWFYKINLTLIILSLVMFIAGCGGGGGGSSSVTPEELTTISVTGKILDSNKNPISGATVTITSDPVVVTTNQWGEFSAKVAPGEHTITITMGNETLYRNTFTAQEGAHITLGSITPNYPDSSGDTQAPTVPGSSVATAASSSQINLSWLASTDNAGVTAYRIYRNGTQLTNSVTGTSYSDTGLSASTQYCYTVSAGDAKGNWSAQSTQSCATTLAAGSTGDTQAPTIPGSVTATAVSLSQINLSWSASSDNTRVTAYRIYRNGTQITNTLTGTTYSDAGLSASTQYCYTVSASDSAGNWSTQSIQSCATTLADSQAPTVPGSVTATAVSSSQINLSWSASADNTGVTGYRLYKGGVFLKQVAGTSTTDTGLSALTQYCYTVSAGDATGNWSAQSTQGAQSCATTFEVDNQAPTVPGSVIATAASSNQINLSWSPSTDNIGVTAYELYRGGILLKQVTGTSTTDTGLSASTQYCYTVRARDAAANWSAQSIQGAQSCAITQSTPFTVIYVSPPSNAFNVATSAPIITTFSESVDPSTVTGLNFAVSVGTSGINLIPGTITCNGATVVFTPDPALTYGTSYRVTIKSGTSGIKDMASNPLASDYPPWSFTTVYSGGIPDLFMQFMSDPTQSNYDILMNAIAAAGDTNEAKLYKAMGELLDIYNSPKTRQIIADAGLPTIGFDTNFEQLESLYDINSIVDTYFKHDPRLYDSDSQALFLETEDRFARVDALLAEANGINETISYGPLYTVNVDSIDVKILRCMVNLAKAYFVYLQSLNLTITNFNISYNNVTYDIRNLYTNKPDVEDYEDLLKSAWLQVLNNNPTLLTYKDRSDSSKLAQFRSTLQTAFNFYGSAVTDIAGLTDEQKRDRYNNAFNLDGDATMAMAELVRDQGMVSAMACMNGTSSQLVFPRAVMTKSEYVNASDEDDLYYLKETFDIYLDHFCPDSAASAITAFRLFGSGADVEKTPRDVILEVTALLEDAEYYPYILCSTPELYLSNISDIIWEDFMETFPIPEAAINIDGLSGDWDGVNVFYTLGTCTYKIARDASNNVYLSIESTHVPSGIYWSSTFGMLMEYGNDDLEGHAGFSINCYISGNSNLTAGCGVWDWANGTTMPAGTCAIFTDSVGVEMRAPVLNELLKHGSGNYFWITERDLVPWYGQDIKLLPEMP